MSTSSSAYVLTLTTIIQHLSLTINIVNLIIGTIGGICNIIVFTASEVRRNACVFYLLCANIFQLLSIYFIVPTRMALDNFGNNLERQSIIYCKIRYYFVIALPESATYFLLLSTLDRCLASSDSVAKRAWSQLKVAHRLSAVVLIVAFVSNVHILIFITIYNNSCQAAPGTVYSLFFAAYLLIIVIILPYTLMLILCIITLLNMKRTKRRVMAVSNVQSQRQTHRFESHIIMIIVLQVLVSSSLLSLRTGSYIYSTLTSGNLNKTAEERVTESFTLQLGVSLYYFSFAISFYVSTLTSKYFRGILWKRITEFRRRYLGQI